MPRSKIEGEPAREAEEAANEEEIEKIRKGLEGKTIEQLEEERDYIKGRMGLENEKHALLREINRRKEEERNTEKERKKRTERQDFGRTYEPHDISDR